MSDLNATRWMIELEVAGSMAITKAGLSVSQKVWASYSRGEGINLLLSEKLEVIANGGESTRQDALSRCA